MPVKSTSKDFKTRALITCAIAPFTLLLHSLVAPTLATAASIGQCAPLAITSIIPKSPRVITENGEKVGVSFYLSVNLKNTNPKMYFYPKTPASVNIKAKSVSPVTVHDGGTDKTLISRATRGGGSVSFNTKRMVIRKQGNRYNLVAKFYGGVMNEHCQGGIASKNYGSSQFTYDLTPMLSGRLAIRTSGRTQGANEGPRPPTRSSGTSDAPRPRGRS